MADGDYEETTLNAYSRAQARLEHFGGYRWRDNAQSMLHGLGFRDDALERELSTFSGGQLTRASLARALAGAPDLLLLDEPTNHLDIASLEWLEQYLIAMDSAIVLVAHDRWFLESVGTAVLELEAGRSRFFAGPWHKWRQEQAARELALGRAIDKQQAEIARLEKFVERFRAKATKARQAQSRVKRLERIERIERDPRDQEGLSFQFARTERAGRVIFELDDGRIEVPGKVLLERARAVAGARRARRARRPQRHRQDDADRHARRAAAAARRQAPHRPQHQTRIPLAARREPRRDRLGARRLPARDGADAEQGAGAARSLPLLRGGGAEAAQRALRRRAPAAVAGDPRQLRRQRADPRRADQPPRRREPRGARGCARAVRRLAAARLPRPRAARRRRLAHGRDRGRQTELLRGRLGRLPARARGAQSGGAGGERSRGRQEAEVLQRLLLQRRRGRRSRSRSRRSPPSRRCRRTPSARRRSSSARSRRPRRRWPSWRSSWPIRSAWSDAGRSAANSERHAAARRAVEELYARYEAVAG